MAGGRNKLTNNFFAHCPIRMQIVLLSGEPKKHPQNKSNVSSVSASTFPLPHLPVAKGAHNWIHSGLTLCIHWTTHRPLILTGSVSISPDPDKLFRPCLVSRSCRCLAALTDKRSFTFTGLLSSPVSALAATEGYRSNGSMDGKFKCSPSMIWSFITLDLFPHALL